MSMYYSQLLVPLDPALVFETDAVARFLEAAAAAGHVGRDPDRRVKTTPQPDGHFVFSMARGMPRSGERGGRYPFSWTCPTSEQEMRTAMSTGRNHQATIWSEHRPTRPPLIALDALQSGVRHEMSESQFDDCFYVAITCLRVEVPLCMSDAGHYEAADIDFGEVIDPDDIPSVAVACHPSKNLRMEIEGIGAARSWVSITFGNYVFPERRLFDELYSREGGLPFVVPELLRLAEGMLGCKLRQTCFWG